MAINHLLRQSATIENPSAGHDRYGNKTLGDSETINVRFQRTYKTIMTPQREREPIHGIVFVKAEDEVEIGAKITYDGTAYRVMLVENVIGPGGRLHHNEAMVQEWSFAE